MKAFATIAVTAAAYTFSTDELAQEEKRLILEKGVEVAGLTIPVQLVSKMPKLSPSKIADIERHLIKAEIDYAHSQTWAGWFPCALRKYFLGFQYNSTVVLQTVVGTTYDMLVGPMYFGSNLEAVNVVFSTQLTQIYVESATTCSTCYGTTRYNFAGELAAGTFVYTAGGVSTGNSVNLISLPAATTTYLSAAYATATDKVCQSYTPNGPTLMCVNMPISVITAYTITGGASAYNAWGSQSDTTVDGWFGLAIDNTSATTQGKNYLYAMSAASPLFSKVFSINIDYQMLTSTVDIGKVFNPGEFQGGSKVGFQAQLDGIMITTHPSPSQIVNSVSWIINSLVAKIDSSMSSTIIPKSLYNFVLNQVLVASIGYYYDRNLGSYVMNCNQKSIMPSIYVYLTNVAGASGVWYVILATDYLHQIATTGFCTVNLQTNGEEQWVLGTDFLNRKAAHFSQNDGFYSFYITKSSVDKTNPLKNDGFRSKPSKVYGWDALTLWSLIIFIMCCVGVAVYLCVGLTAKIAARSEKKVKAGSDVQIIFL